MKDKIYPIDTNIKTNQIQHSVSLTQSPINTPSMFKDSINFSEIELPNYPNSTTSVSERMNYQVLIKLFTKIIQSEIDIYPSKMKKYNTYIVEGSFQKSRSNNSRHRIYLPIQGATEPLLCPKTNLNQQAISQSVELYVKDIFNNSSDYDILKLIVIASHEFGHYISYTHGNHTVELQNALNIMQIYQNNLIEVTNITWIIFQEEVLAWRFAYEVLMTCKFTENQLFKQVKTTSLSAYIKTLKLYKSTVKIHLKLAALGEDFTDCYSLALQV